MTWLALLVLAAAAMAPLAWTLGRPRRARGRHEADLALYRAQLEELEREKAAGRLDEPAHRAATLEVQRRLLAAPADAPRETPGRSTAWLIAALALIPAAALGLYLLRGIPGMPSAPYELRREAAARDDTLLATLRQRLAQLDPRSEQARQGWVLLGGAERARGRTAEAAEAWRRALDARFDPSLAGELAELELERGEADRAIQLLTEALAREPRDPRLRFLAGLAALRAGRPEVARSTWRGLLNDAPADAPWRASVQRRLDDLP